MRKMLKSMVRSANRFRPAALMLQIMKQSDPQGNGKKSVDVDELFESKLLGNLQKTLKDAFFRSVSSKTSNPTHGTQKFPNA